MTRTAWLDLTTTALLELDHELRALLRQHHYGPPDHTTQLATRRANGPGPGGIKISCWEARMLLRGAVAPLPQNRALRAAHASLHLALQRFLDRLPNLSAEPTDDRATELGVELAAALHAWLRASRWRQATAAAGARWHQPVAISPLTRHQPPPAATTEREQELAPPGQLALPFEAAA